CYQARLRRRTEAHLAMALSASCAHRLHLLEDSATSLFLVSCTDRCSGQGCTATFLLRFQHAFMPQEDRYGKAIRTFYTQDQTSKKPLIALAAYSGTTVSQVTHRLATLTRTILGRDFLLVADKEWYCGQLIQELHAQYGIAILTP